MDFHFAKAFLNKIVREFLLRLPLTRIEKENIEKVYEFFCAYPDFRSVESCSRQLGISELQCAKIKHKLYKERKLGLYFFEAGKPPQKFMQDYILERFPHIFYNSKILEVGPGEYPLFDFNKYPEWRAVDRFLEDDEIKFKNLKWAKNKYPKDKIKHGGYEDLSQLYKNELSSYDLVVGSHSYEHTLLPIKSLKEICSILKPGAVIVLFVPDGFSDDVNTKDPTHTLYLHKEMIKEFFFYAGGFKSICVESFRPNADLVISAIKE